jgi:hypothetical protein
MSASFILHLRTVELTVLTHGSQST